jgi:hypothetical protein
MITRTAVSVVVVSGGTFHALLLKEHGLEFAPGWAEGRSRTGAEHELVMAWLRSSHQNSV